MVRPHSRSTAEERSRKVHLLHLSWYCCWWSSIRCNDSTERKPEDQIKLTTQCLYKTLVHDHDFFFFVWTYLNLQAKNTDHDFFFFSLRIVRPGPLPWARFANDPSMGFVIGPIGPYGYVAAQPTLSRGPNRPDHRILTTSRLWIHASCWYICRATFRLIAVSTNLDDVIKNRIVLCHFRRLNQLNRCAHDYGFSMDLYANVIGPSNSKWMISEFLYIFNVFFRTWTFSSTSNFTHFFSFCI